MKEGNKMAIKVKVFDETMVPEIKEEDKPKILTAEYVEAVNRGISHRIRQSQTSIARGVAEAQIDTSVFD